MPNTTFNETDHPRLGNGTFTNRGRRDGQKNTIDATQGWLEDDAEANAEVTGDRAAAVVPGAARIRIVDGWGGTLAADITYQPFDLKAQLKPLYDGLLGPDENDIDEFLRVRGRRIKRLLGENCITVDGDWENATITQTIALEDEVATCFGHVGQRAAKDFHAREFIAAIRGENDALSGINGDLMEDSCTNCFTDTGYSDGADGYCGDCADRRDNDEED